MPYIQVDDGVQIYYEERGAGEKYIVSSRSRIEHASSYTAALADLGYHVIEIQLRGYGKSTHVTEDYGMKWYDIWASDIVKAAKALGVEKFVYTGVSHGSGVGWHIIRRQPEVLIGFAGVVCGPHSKDGHDTGAERQRTLDSALDEEKWKAYSLERYHRDCANPPSYMNEEDLAEFMENAKEKYEDFLNMELAERLISPKKPFPDLSTEEELIRELEKIDLPCIFLGGMFDPISTTANMVRTGSAVKGSKTILYQDSDHGLCKRYPKQIARDIDQFLQEKRVFE